MNRWLFTSSLLAGSLIACDGAPEAPSEAPSEEDKVGQASQEILGGSQFSAGDWPTVVGVLSGGGACTGTMVAPDVIMTAAHCIGPAQATEVVFDATSLFGNGFRVGASETFANPGFTRPGGPDIGIIRLETPVTDRQPSPVNYDAAKSPAGIIVDIVGYGVNSQGSSGTGFFLKGQPSVPCVNVGIQDSQFLCFDQRQGRGKCQGDSGGPSFANIDGVEALVGITSFGDQNCQAFGADFRTDAGRDFVSQVAPDILCIADGLCDAACTADPDCRPACVVDSDCETDNVCSSEGSCLPAPLTPGGLGAACSGSDCVVGDCAGSADDMRCVTNCTADSECPSGFSCREASDGGGVCWESGGGGGCQTGSGFGGGASLLLIAFGLLAVRRRREISAE